MEGNAIMEASDGLLRQVSVLASSILPPAMLLHQLFCWTAALFSAAVSIR